MCRYADVRMRKISILDYKRFMHFVIKINLSNFNYSFTSTSAHPKFAHLHIQNLHINFRIRTFAHS